MVDCICGYPLNGGVGGRCSQYNSANPNCGECLQGEDGGADDEFFELLRALFEEDEKDPEIW